VVLEQVQTRTPKRVGAIAFSIGVAVIVLLALIGVILDSGSVSPAAPIRATTDELWVLIAAALVFLMQVGFLGFEVGLARANHRTAVAIKNIIDWTVASIAFYLVGFGLMFGASAGGLIGTDLFAVRGLGTVISGSISGPTFFVFQLAFAGTAMTIVSGSLVERTTFVGYTTITAVIGIAIYPVVGHWIWGGLLEGADTGWLARLGFIDFAGATVVHSTGAWVALVGVIMVGPRLGRFGPDGTARKFPPSDLAFTVLGALLLWIGWWGFNGGSVLSFDSSVPGIILVTNLAGAAGVASASLHTYLFGDRDILPARMIGGALGGLVAVTASANVVEPLSALAIGLVAGIVHNLAADLLLRMKIDDALGAIPVHGACGIWGTIAVAIFAPSSALVNSRLEQFVIQTIGITVVMAWSAGIAWLVFSALWNTVGVRVSPAHELGGLEAWNQDDHIEHIEEEQLADDELEDLLR